MSFYLIPCWCYGDHVYFKNTNSPTYEYHETLINKSNVYLTIKPTKYILTDKLGDVISACIENYLKMDLVEHLCFYDGVISYENKRIKYEKE